MFQLKQVINGLFAAAFAAALSYGTAFADVKELNLVDPNKGFSRVWRMYPEMDAEFVRTGTPRSVAQVRRVSIGLNKQQLVNAIGRPVSAAQDGAWNFNLALPLPQRNRLICQYKVYFDQDSRVVGSIWRRPQCADLIVKNRK